MSSETQWISVSEAAQAIFRTKSPTPPQIQKVCWLVAKQALRANSRKTHVTADSVAKYVATHMESRRLSQTGAAAQPPEHKKCEQQLKTLYRTSLGDYLVSLFRKKKRDQLAPPLRRAVFAGQAVGILIPALLIGWMLYNAFLGPPPELEIVRNFMAVELTKSRIVDWSAPKYWEQDASTSIDVRFESNVAGGKKIMSRTFVIKEGRVVGW